MFKVVPINPPPGTLSAAEYARAVQQARGIAETVGLQEARAVSRSWRHKPSWQVERKGDESNIVTDDEIFIYQDKGTKPHPIVARKKRALYWAGANHPVKRVNHPGTKAQHYSDKIAAAMQKHYKRIMDEQIKAVVP